MASYKQPKPSFNQQELEFLDLALAGALAMVTELGLSREGLKPTLMRRLFVIASKGNMDPEALRDGALKDMNIDRIAN